VSGSGGDRPRRPDPRVVLIVLGILAAGYLYVYHAVIQYLRVRRVRAVVERRLDAARERNRRLETEVRLLQSDEATLEYEIRRQLGYYAPGERVIVLRSSNTAVSER